MRLETGRLLDVLLVLAMLFEGLHPHDPRLVHFVADDGAGPRFAHRPLRCCLFVGHAVSFAAAPRRRRGLGASGSGVVASPSRSLRWIPVKICARSWRTCRIWR